MASALDNIDAEYLISAVEERPEIWDTSNEHFRNRDAKERAWIEIAAAFIQNFIQFHDEDASTLIPKLQKRWRAVRDAFKRFKAKGPSAKSDSKKQPKYIDNLKFLEKNMDVTENGTEQFFIDTDQTLREVLEQSDGDEDGYPLAIHAKSEISEKKRNSKKVLYEESPTKHCLATYDGDKSFLDSLLPTLQTFNEEQKLQFRIEVLNALQRVKNLFPQQAPATRGPLKSYVLTPDGELKEEKKRPTTAAERMRKMRERRRLQAGLPVKNTTLSTSVKAEETASTSKSFVNDSSISPPDAKKMKTDEENESKIKKESQVDSVILIWTDLLGHKLQDFDLITRECLMNETDNIVFKAKIKMMRQNSSRTIDEGNRTTDHHPYNMEVRYVDISNISNTQPQEQIMHSTPIVTTTAGPRAQQLVNKCEIVYVDPHHQ